MPNILLQSCLCKLEGYVEKVQENIEVSYDIHSNGDNMAFEHQLADLCAHAWPTQFPTSIYSRESEPEKQGGVETQIYNKANSFLVKIATHYKDRLRDWG